MTARTLTEFLLARIAEDEASVTSGECRCCHELWRPDCPDRILAECEAKRRIVGWLITEDGGPDPDVAAVLDDVAGMLADAYANHPDFDEAWRP